MIKIYQSKIFFKFCFYAFSALLISWVALASIRVVLNTTKIFTEERQWMFFTDAQKREKIYGDVALIYKHLDKLTTKESNVYLISNDARPFYILRYLLYPKKIFWVKDSKTIKKVTKADYVLFYHLPEPKKMNNFFSIDSFKTDKSSSYLYKIL